MSDECHIECDVTRVRYSDKLALFNQVADIVKPHLQTPISRMNGEDLLLWNYNGNDSKIIVFLRRDDEWLDNWVLSIYVSELFQVMASEDLANLLVVLKEFFDALPADPDYAELARYESEYDSANPDWEALGFVGEKQ